jgi:hypothetical protein
MNMRHIPFSTAISCLLLVGLAVPSTALPATSAPACEQITAACKSAGFTQGGLSSGTGLTVHCIAPIMQGAAQPSGAKRPLPQIDAHVVAACKTSNPRFGQATILAQQLPAAASAASAIGSGAAGGTPLVKAAPPTSDRQLLTAVEAMSKQVAEQTQLIQKLQKDLDTYDKQINGRLMVICLTSFSAYAAAGSAAWAAPQGSNAIVWGLPIGTGKNAFEPVNVISACTKSDTWKNSKVTPSVFGDHLFTPFN